MWETQSQLPGKHGAVRDGAGRGRVGDTWKRGNLGGLSKGGSHHLN